MAPMRSTGSKRNRNPNVRAAILTPHLTRAGGGLFNSVRRLSQTLGEQGVGIGVLGLSDRFEADDLPAWEPLHPQSFPVIGPAALGWSPRLGDALTRSGADIAHCHGLWMYPSAACLRWAKRTGKPYVISPRGMLDLWALKRSRWKKRFAGFLFQNEHLRRAACIHALCEPEAQAVRALGFRNPICVIPNGIDLPAPDDSRPPPWEGAIPAGAKVLFYLGRLHPKKGLADLLRAWRSVDESRWHLVVAGWDQDGHEAELKNLAKDIDAARVHFPGAQFGASKTAAFRACDAFVLPSLSEGLPMAVLEAWAHAKPVLMTRACNLPEGFADRAAIEIEPGNCARSLRALFSTTDPELIETGARGRKLVETRFTWPVVAGETRAVYDWLAGHGPQPSCVTRCPVA